MRKFLKRRAKIKRIKEKQEIWVIHVHVLLILRGIRRKKEITTEIMELDFLELKKRQKTEKPQNKRTYRIRKRKKGRKSHT